MATGTALLLGTDTLLCSGWFTGLIGLILGGILTTYIREPLREKRSKKLEFLEGSDITKTYTLNKNGKEFILRFERYKEQVLGRLSTDNEDDMIPYYKLVAHPQHTRTHIVKILIDAGFNLM